MSEEGRLRKVAVDGGDFGSAMVEVVGRALADVDDPPEVVDAAEPAAGEPPDVLVSLPVDADRLGAALVPGVRWVHVLAAGVDGFPFELLDGRTLTCSRGATAPAIAEFILAAMLAFEKDLPAQWCTEPPAQWNRANLGTLIGRTLGLVGLGSIGTEVARRALGFDMTVRAVRRTAAPSPLPGIAVAPSLEELAATADHLVVVAPATPATRHLVGAGVFAALKPGAHLVNVARGTLVDQDALRAALDDGTVAMATLDVTDPEPLPGGHWLYRHPRTRISPHVSWSSPATLPRTLGIFADNARRYRAGEPLAGVVDPGAGY